MEAIIGSGGREEIVIGVVNRHLVSGGSPAVKGLEEVDIRDISGMSN
jgi:hypothetical protein